MKKIITKIVLASVLVIGLFGIVTPFSEKSVQASASFLDLEHNIDTDVNKIWRVKLNQAVDSKMANKIWEYVVVTDGNGVAVNGVSISYDKPNNTVVINPPQNGYAYNKTYTITVKHSLANSEGKLVEQAAIKEFSTPIKPGSSVNELLGEITYNDLNYTLDAFVDKQYAKKPPIYRSFGYTGQAEKNDIKMYMDTERLMVDDYAIYQFMKLTYIEGITAENLNSLFDSKGILAGKGQDFLDASKLHDVNPAYLVSHAILETSNGNSQLAKGVDYTTSDGTVVKVYNFFGIGAHDNDPINLGAKRAYDEGWFTPTDAIIGGAKWIAEGYIHSTNSSIADQDTLYEMKWNIHNYTDPWHQYATDIAWAYKQIKNLKNILDACPNAKLEFEIPRYK